MKLNSQEAISKFNSQSASFRQTGILAENDKLNLYLDSGEIAEIDTKLLPLVQLPEAKYNRVLYGKNSLEGIVGAESDGDNLYLFLEKNGAQETKIIPNRLWITAIKNYDGVFSKMEGDREYKFIRHYKNFEKWEEARKMKYKGLDLFFSYCPVESNFISRGFTYFKGLQLKDISILSFDIETDGLKHTPNSDIFLISNTFRSTKGEERKLFDFHDYPTRKAMLEAWCKWVREKNPSVMVGHNIYGYDFPYLKHVASLNDVSLDLGRDGSSLQINSYPSKFRKDGNEKIEYFKCRVWGREIVDTYFLSFKYDISRKYESNALKQIIKQEGLEKEGRVFVDASRIKMYTKDPEMWAKIRDYAEADSDDALKLFDLMAPSFFYANQLIPKRFEDLINGASGSQLNSMMLRCYLQDHKSIPKPSEAKKYEGAISMGIPGIYSNVLKIDAVQLYPNILLSNNLYNSKKDPENLLSYCLKEFMKNRKYYKDLYKKTQSEQHDAIQNSFKTFSNSIYGFLGAPGLNFNSPDIAAKITEIGRDYLKMAIKWATGNEFEYYANFYKKDENENDE